MLSLRGEKNHESHLGSTCNYPSTPQASDKPSKKDRAPPHPPVSLPCAQGAPQPGSRLLGRAYSPSSQWLGSHFCLWIAQHGLYGGQSLPGGEPAVQQSPASNSTNRFSFPLSINGSFRILSVPRGSFEKPVQGRIWG